jgi:hypothetical protein
MFLISLGRLSERFLPIEYVDAVKPREAMMTISNDGSDSLREKGRASHPRFCNDNDLNRGRGCLRILPLQRQLLSRRVHVSRGIARNYFINSYNDSGQPVAR